MLRLFVSVTVFLVLALATAAGDPPESKVKEFAKDIEQLNGSWNSPKIDLGPGVTGHFQLKLEFKKDSIIGQATVLGSAYKSGIVLKVDPSWIAELKEKDKKRFIVLAEMRDGKRAEFVEIAYEVNVNKLKLSSPKVLQFKMGTNPVEISGEWERRKADKK